MAAEQAVQRPRVTVAGGDDELPVYPVVVLLDAWRAPGRVDIRA